MCVSKVVVDVADLEFLDSIGLHDILLLDAAARAHGAEVTVTSTRPSVRRVFEIAGLGHLLGD